MFYVVIIVVTVVVAVPFPPVRPSIPSTVSTLYIHSRIYIYMLSWRRTVRLLISPTRMPVYTLKLPWSNPVLSSVEWWTACVYIYVHNNITKTLVRKPFVPNKTLVLTLLYYTFCAARTTLSHELWWVGGSGKRLCCGVVPARQPQRYGGEGAFGKRRWQSVAPQKLYYAALREHAPLSQATR